MTPMKGWGRRSDRKARVRRCGLLAVAALLAAVWPSAPPAFAVGEEAAFLREPLEMNHPVVEGTIGLARLDAAALAAQPRPAEAADRSPPAAPAEVGQWDRFQAGVVNRTAYADPFRDVTLEVVYTRPDGSTVEFWGYYDGGALWMFRFMPDQLGTWKYEARFSDGAPGLAGTFECVASDLPGMLCRDETNPMWFGFRGGNHGLIRAFHVGDRFFAANWPSEERQRFLDWAGKQGYNMLSIASHYLNRDAPDRGRPWATPALWPLDPAEYRRMEGVLDDLAERGIMVFPFAGFHGRASSFPADPADAERFVRYTLARIGPYWNILLNVGGPEPHLRGSPYMTGEEIHSLGRLIAATDVFDHPLSVHNPTGDDWFRDADWLTYGTLQGPKTADLARLSERLLKNHHPEKPLLAQETLWSGNVFHMRNLGNRDYSDDELRRNAWVIHMSAAALVFADNGGGNSSAGFSGSMNPADAEQHRHDIIKEVWDLAEQFPFYRMKPRQDLIDNGFCLAEPGRHYLVFLPAPGTVSVQVEGGPFTIRWINARNGDDRRSGGTTRDGAGLTSPGDGQEWLLWLVR